MTFRTELQPDVATAQKLYPAVFDLITAYDEACDAGKSQAIDRIIDELSAVTGKQLQEVEIAEYWGWINKEDLAFQLALPKPVKVDNFTKKELIAILEDEQLFEDKFSHFYETLLTVNFAHPSPFAIVFGSDESNETKADLIMNYKPVESK